MDNTENTNRMGQSLITLEKRLGGVEKSIENLGETLKDVKVALLGNDFNKTGIVHTIAEHHQRLSALEKALDRGKWLVIGLSMGTGGLIYEIIKQLLKI